MIDKPILYLSDISLIGRCSYTVALPIFSVLGLELTLLPSLFLSTHTGFENPFKRDFSAECEKIIEHFEALDISFSSLFIGYLNGKNMFSLVDSLLESKITRNSKIFIDPIFADRGKFYSGKDSSYVDFYRGLIKKADIIFPNMSEAAFLCGKEGLNPHETSRFLMDLRAKNVVLTGLEEKDRIGVMINGENEVLARKYEGNFHGTGDMLSSIVISAFLKGFDIQRGSEIAVKWISNVIEKSLKDENSSDGRFGLPFEPHLCELKHLFGGNNAL